MRVEHHKDCCVVTNSDKHKYRVAPYKGGLLVRGYDKNGALSEDMMFLDEKLEVRHGNQVHSGLWRAVAAYFHNLYQIEKGKEKS